MIEQMQHVEKIIEVDKIENIVRIEVGTESKKIMSYRGNIKRKY